MGVVRSRSSPFVNMPLLLDTVIVKNRRTDLTYLTTHKTTLINTKVYAYADGTPTEHEHRLAIEMNDAKDLSLIHI